MGNMFPSLGVKKSKDREGNDSNNNDNNCHFNRWLSQKPIESPSIPLSSDILGHTYAFHINKS